MENECCICKNTDKVKYYKGAKYCGRHHRQMRRYGHVQERTQLDKNEIRIYEDYAEIIIYKNNKEFMGMKIDVEDVELCKKYKWHESKGYARAWNGGNNLFLHRLLLNAKDDELIDHINHCPSDNRKCNLRKANYEQNSHNRARYIRGVTYREKKNKWEVSIAINKKQVYLGLFETFEEAIKTRKDAELKYYGEFATVKDVEA